MGAINRPLHCHPFTLFRASSERSEGSVAMSSEMLRCAQHDRALTPTDAWINVLLSMIGPYGWTDEFVNVHNRAPTLINIPRFLRILQQPCIVV